MGEPNTNLGNWYLDWKGETCSIVTALKESFLITTFKTFFALLFIFASFTQVDVEGLTPH